MFFFIYLFILFYFFFFFHELYYALFLVKGISYDFVKANHNYRCFLCFVVLEHKNKISNW